MFPAKKQGNLKLQLTPKRNENGHVLAVSAPNILPPEVKNIYDSSGGSMIVKFPNLFTRSQNPLRQEGDRWIDEKPSQSHVECNIREMNPNIGTRAFNMDQDNTEIANPMEQIQNKKTFKTKLHYSNGNIKTHAMQLTEEKLKSRHASTADKSLSNQQNNWKLDIMKTKCGSKPNSAPAMNETHCCREYLESKDSPMSGYNEHRTEKNLAIVPNIRKSQSFFHHIVPESFDSPQGLDEMPLISTRLSHESFDTHNISLMSETDESTLHDDRGWEVAEVESITSVGETRSFDQLIVKDFVSFSNFSLYHF